ncbi:MAG: hypothetical protein M3Y87_18540 [Myxococcota bacterium]|nr:hypothetical protein [Myxococcota bacterium]
MHRSSLCSARFSLVCAAIAVALLMSACRSEDPRLVIVARSDLAPREEVDRIDVELVGIGVAASVSIGRRDSLAEGIVVYDRALAPIAERHARVSFYLGDALVATRDVVIEHLADRELLVDVPRACVDIGCELELDETCVLGQCGAPTCVDGTEPECPPAMCDDDAQCAVEVECATGSCRDGVCVALGDDARCERREWCDPTQGCRARRLGSGAGGIGDAGVEPGEDDLDDAGLPSDDDPTLDGG